jgi:hypothetical protein
MFQVVGIVQAIVLSLALCPSGLAQTASAAAPSSRVTTPRQQPTNTVSESAEPPQNLPTADADETLQADDGSQDMMSSPPEGEAMLRVRISVPHQTRAVSAISIYPYPPRPPRMIKSMNKIDDKPKSIRNQLINIGYSNRNSDTKLFPNSGWRWHYILKAALQKSGTRPPTNIVTMYPWTFKMVPYVQTEIRRINEIEADRKIRYQTVVKDFEENGVELENEALQKNLSPIEINLKNGTRKLLSGAAAIAPGTWYIVASHKTSSLNFFWQIPVTVSAGEKSTVQLTQTNALVIEGAW